MRHLFEPRLVHDPFGGPGLYVDLRVQRRALLFDLGDVAGLPPRKLLRISHVFVSHTHMDHFAGFDQLLRVVLGRKEGIVLVGGPRFVVQVEHKLRAYTWNVVHRYSVELVLDVREPCAPFELSGDVLHDEALMRVRGRFVDHEMPCLAFAVEEKPRARVAKDRLAALGVSTGPWLRDLKRAIACGSPAQTPIGPMRSARTT